jgi:hypothetical protein
MTTTRGAAAGKYGFGLVPRKAPWDSPAIVHDGQDDGFSSHNGWLPAESLSVTLLYNALPRLEVNMADFVGLIVLGGTPRPIAPMPVIELPVAATQGPGRPKFVGAYEIGVGRMFMVTFGDGNLYVTPPGGSRAHLFLQSGTTYTFGSPQSTTTVTFRVDGDGSDGIHGAGQWCRSGVAKAEAGIASRPVHVLHIVTQSARRRFASGLAK